MDASIYSIKPSHKNWPELINQLPPSARPASLYVKGTLPPADALIVAVVGTRKPTSYGREAAVDIVRILSSKGIIVISGLALGIDTLAHKAALDAGLPTMAVLGSGIDESVLYPKDNIGLARRIIEQGGAIISEHAPDVKPALWTFPQRNRIIAGIAKATVIIEAGIKSGSLITARFATEYGRDVLALPGSIYAPGSAGTNSLIKQGALPITAPKDVLDALGISHDDETAKNHDLNTQEIKIVSLLGEERSLDFIIKESGISAGETIALTTGLEIRGIIKSIGGGIYRKA